MKTMLAWMQLVRLPNVFTAIADILAGALLALGRWPMEGEWILLLRICLASACLYSAGMALNDYFDVEEDRRDRPFRPIPSGRVSRSAAGVLGFGLLLSGIFLGCEWSSIRSLQSPTLVVLALGILIVGYDAWLKRTWFGPVAMGSCRFLNLLLGASHFAEWNQTTLAAATLIGCYIVGVTIVAKSETHQGLRLTVCLGSGVVLAALVALLVLQRTTVFRLLPKQEPWPIFLAIILSVVLGRFLFWAMVRTRPSEIQSAVKASIFWLIVLDTIFACHAVGEGGLGMLLLLIPAILLGRIVYST